MADYMQFDVPKRNANGQTSIYCRNCKREIARTVDSRIRSVSKCAICVLEEQGVMDGAKYVLPQYVMLDPTKPVPIGVEGDDAEFTMFPEEKDNRVRSSGGVVGTAKALYRALGFGKQEEQAPPESRKVAAKRKGSLRS